MRKKKAVKVLERAIIEAQEDLHFEERQNARAYNNGVVDGIGLALSLLAPKSPVISLTSTWWEEPEQEAERTRERVIELRHIDMSDPEPVACYAGLFETAEAN